MPPTPSSGCYLCGRQSNAIFCDLCHAIQYCGVDHQASDFDRHARECQIIRRAGAAASRTEQEILALRPDPALASSADEISRGKKDTDQNEPYIYTDQGFPVGNLDFGAPADDPDYNSEWMTYDYDKEAYDIPGHIYDRVKHRKHLIDLFQNRESSIYWTFLGTKYFVARLNLLKAILEVDSDAALKLAFNHAVDLHLLSREEWQPRGITMVILLRLGEYQQFFEYIRFWTDREPSTDYDTDLNLNALKVLEHRPKKVTMDPLKYTIHGGKIGEFASHSVEAETLCILMRLLCIQDLKDLERFQQIEHWLQQRTNFDVVKVIQKHIPETDVVAGNRGLWGKNNAELIRKMECWNQFSFYFVECWNTKFWSKLLKIVGKGRLVKEEIQLVGDRRKFSELCWRLWRDVPGGIDFVRKFITEIEPFYDPEDMATRNRLIFQAKAMRDAINAGRISDEEWRIVTSC
ncbi:hypothetical protein ABW20_dc0109922 [Dactylellina cionopaga]|nr:hypothetical protein ABW20_dc0109922 [Dactylellina cionopaga]